MFGRSNLSRDERRTYQAIERLEKYRHEHGGAWTEEERKAHQDRLAEQYARLDQIHRDSYVESHGYEPGEAPKRKRSEKKASNGSYYRSDLFGTTRIEYPDRPDLWSYSTASSRSYSKPAPEAFETYEALVKEAEVSDSQAERHLGKALDQMLRSYRELEAAVESLEGITVTTPDGAKPAGAAKPAASPQA